MTIRTTYNILIIFCAATAQKYQNVIDVDDILSPEFMPGSLLMLENPEVTLQNITNTTTVTHAYLNQSLLAGSVQEALSTMDFHRSKMNEYLCRNFIAEQILEDLSLTRLRRRSGTVDPKAKIMNHKPLTLSDNLIDDEGSKSYKSWLSKYAFIAAIILNNIQCNLRSTTLEDIYKHYQSIENKNGEEVGEDKEDIKESGEYDQHVEYQQVPLGPEKLSYPSGSAYGYGGTLHGTTGQTYGHGWGVPSVGHYGYSGPAISHHGEDNIGHIHIHTDPSPPKWHGVPESSKKDLTELFDVALTALAYLSFGMFLVHVVTCIAHGKKKENTVIYSYVPIISTTTTAGTVGMNGGGSVGTAMAMSSDDAEMGMSMNDDMNDMMMMTGDGSDMMMVEGMPDDGGDMMMAEGEMMTGEGGENGEMMMMTGEGGENGEMMMMTGEGGENGEMMMMTGDGGEMMMVEGMPDEGGGMTGAGDEMMGEEGDAVEGARGSGNVGWVTKNLGRGAFRRDGSTGEATTMAAGRRRRRRRKRKATIKEIPQITQPNHEALNELARHVLTSIEAALIAHQDNGTCLRKYLCENNKYSRSLHNSNKIWIPVWSLGMSWLSGKLARDVPPAASMLDSLKASILGLGKANCEVIYQDCNLKVERETRRKRRRK